MELNSFHEVKNPHVCNKNLSHCDISQRAAHIYLQVGLEGALGFLYAHFCQFAPITKLQCVVLDYAEGLSWQLASLGTFIGRVQGHVVRLEDASKGSAWESTLEEHANKITIRNALPPLDTIPPFMEPYKVHKASLYIPLCSKNRQYACLHMYADIPDVFKEEDVQCMSLYCQDLGDALSSSLFDQMHRRNSEASTSLLKLMEQCPNMGYILKKARNVALADTTVLLTGETGTGKGLMAEVIHELSGRRNGPFVAVNCGAFPESLIDGLLFGHERGAFTGAITANKGFFEQAQGGTLFLDEIGDLPLSIQARLLRVLDKFQVQRLGSARLIDLDIRIIAATNRDLKQMVAEKLFREDLFYRLHIYTIPIPPLRQRPDDLPVLVSHFLHEKCCKLQLSQMPLVTKVDLDLLRQYPWSGNVRELEHMVESSLVDYRAKGQKGFSFMPQAFAENTQGTQADAEKKEGIFSQILTGSTYTAKARTPHVFAPLEEVIDTHINNVLAHTGGRVAGPGGAADLLGIHRTTLYRKLRKMGIVLPEAEK